jgi:PTS system nitrogen regulatory IIA component
MRFQELCDLLNLTTDQVERLIQHEGLPARRLGGQWRFLREEVARWLSQHYVPGLSEERWKRLEVGRAAASEADPLDPILAPRIPEHGIALRTDAKTRASVLRKVVEAAEATGLCYDPQELENGLREREEMSSTAIPGGIAIPHPPAPLRYTLGDSFVVVATTVNPVPFGSPDGGLTDLFFMVASQDEQTHLHLLARLARVLRHEHLPDDLRRAETERQVRTLIVEAERQIALELDPHFARRRA